MVQSMRFRTCVCFCFFFFIYLCSLLLWICFSFRDKLWWFHVFCAARFSISTIYFGLSDRETVHGLMVCYRPINSVWMLLNELVMCPSYWFCIQFQYPCIEFTVDHRFGSVLIVSIRSICCFCRRRRRSQKLPPEICNKTNEYNVSWGAALISVVTLIIIKKKKKIE